MKSKILFFIIGLLIGVIALTGVRYFTYQDPNYVHFHADIAIFINGNKFDLSKDKYMEPVSSCTLSDTDTQKTAIERVHLHSNDGSTIHVHDSGVTWQHFISNIRFNAGKDYLVTDDGTMYKNNEKQKVTYILNGKVEENPMNFEIKSEDKLLINYGDESVDSLVSDRYKQVSSSAHEFNEKNDPATCKGNQNLNILDKLRKTFINK